VLPVPPAGLGQSTAAKRLLSAFEAEKLYHAIDDTNSTNNRLFVKKVNVWTVAIAPLTWVRLVTSSALQSRKWQLIGMSQWHEPTSTC